jgi:phthiocerol/phenolphthiocerol synthesis type-I polyketide synthase E
MVMSKDTLRDGAFSEQKLALLASLLEEEGVPQPPRVLSFSSLTPLNTNGSRPPLFCMHGAGGTVMMYRDLSRHLGDNQPFYGLQAQGLDGSCLPLTTIAEMAAIYVKEILRVQPHGPYFIAGYCMGGTIAFEVAQQLREAGEAVALLALFDTMNWHKIPLTLWAKSSHATQRLFFHAASFLSLDSRGKATFLKEKFAILKNRIPAWRGMLFSRFGRRRPNAVSESLVFGQNWRANDRASWAYLPKPYPGVITDIRPAKQYRIFSKPDLKWDRLSEGQDVVVLPVYPGTMLVEPFVAQLAGALQRAMDAAIQRYKCGYERGSSVEAVTEKAQR